VKGGKARLLAISGDKRASVLPDVPTFAEAGVKGYGVINFTGLWAPKGTPPAVLAKLEAEIAKAVAAPDIKAYAEGIAADPRSIGSTAFAKLLSESTANWGKVAADTKFDKQ
jgi:tripartite-type tricarboxylate transporter receptor subunit TctC